MTYDAEILTSWASVEDGEGGSRVWVPFVTAFWGIRAWEDATGREGVNPPNPNLVIIKARVLKQDLERLMSDRNCCLLWYDQTGEIVERRRFVEDADALKISSFIDSHAGPRPDEPADGLGMQVVGGDYRELAISVLAWRLKMWLRTLPN